MKKIFHLSLIILIQMSSAVAQDNRFSSWIYDVGQVMEDMNLFTNPKDRQYLVRPALENWLNRGLNISSRDRWADETQMSPDQKKEIYAKLDEIKKTADKKMPAYVPGPERFAFGTKEEIEMLKGKVTDLSEATVHRIGIQEKTWIVEKDNYGNITGRRKWGYIWARYNNPNVPYCRMIELYLYQQYEGGGTYGEAYATFERAWWVGCPK